MTSAFASPSAPADVVNVSERGSAGKSRVYFIKPVGLTGPVKIGCSVAPDGRRRTLESWSPFRLEIIAEIDGDVHLERRFHALFKPSHDRREWFHWSLQMSEVIAAINAGTFDAGTLPAPLFVSSGKKKGEHSGWTEENRLKMSYYHKVRHAEKRSGRRLPFGFYVEEALKSTAGRAKLDAFLADPVAHGVTIAEHRAAYNAQVAKYHRDTIAAARQRLEALEAKAA